MEFKSLKNIETSFQQIRLYAFIYTICCTLIVIAACFFSYQFAEKQREKIYLVEEGKSLIAAYSYDIRENIQVEARTHVKTFHELFYDLKTPIKSAIEQNAEKAIILSNPSVHTYYMDLVETGYYARLIRGNVQQELHIDSLVCNFNQYPYQVTTYAKLHFVRESNTTIRNLITNSRLIKSNKCDESPFGFTIEAFEVLENKDIQVIKR